MPDWKAIADGHYGVMPHPFAPSLSVAEYPVAMHLARVTKFGGKAEPGEAEKFWQEFKQLQMPPGQYLDTIKRIAPLSFRLVNRPPTMEEIKQHSALAPDQSHKYYASLPDPDYPDVPAGEMVRSLAAATPYAAKHAGRAPTKGEAAFFHHAKLNTQGIDQHYQMLKEDVPGTAPY